MWRSSRAERMSRAFFEEKFFEDELVVFLEIRRGAWTIWLLPADARLKIFVQRTDVRFARLTDYLRETGAPKWPMHAVGHLKV